MKNRYDKTVIDNDNINNNCDGKDNDYDLSNCECNDGGNGNNNCCYSYWGIKATQS